MTRSFHRPAWADVDLDAIEHNVRVMADLVAPSAMCAVVKADGYGHGAVPVARAALAGGASWLAVALVEEGIELRDAGIAAPVLLLSEPPFDAMGDVVGHDLTPTLYTLAGVEAAAKAVAARDAVAASPQAVHVKVDTGMHRVGASAEDAVAVGAAVSDRPELRLEGLWTHFAVADEEDRTFTAEQLRRFDEVRAAFAGAGLDPPLVHAANSAGAMAYPEARLGLVRCGIEIYGHAPSVALRDRLALRPAMTLRADVTFVKEVDRGERISYGLRYAVAERTVIATVPLGYADGVPRRLSAVGGEVLVGGRRRPIAGTITMDQLMVDCGPGATTQPGDEVVLLGAQGDDAITADDWADALDTISYEIVCGIGPRVPRRYHWSRAGEVRG